MLLVLMVTASGAQGPGIGPGGRGEFGRGSGEILSLLYYPAVQEEIKLKSAQKEKIDAVKKAIFMKRQALLSRRNGGVENAGIAGGEIRSGNAAATGNFGGASFTPNPGMEADLEKMQGDSDSANANITNKILTKQQVARLTQIDLQRQGLMAILNEDVAMKLKINDDVLAQMKGIQNESRQTKRETYLAFRQNGPTFQTADGQLDREALRTYRDSSEGRATQDRMQQTTDQMQNQTIAQIGKLLSKNQKAKFKAMHGKDFDLTKLTKNPATPPSPEAAATTSPTKGQPQSNAKK